MNSLFWIACISTLAIGTLSASPKIAIIGGGIGGSSAAFWLRNLFEDEKIEIDIYESKQLGGRMSTAKIAGREYEMGASILHPSNKYMTDFMHLTELKKRDQSDELFGIYDGKDFLFEESPWELVTLFKLLWRYGGDIFRLRSYIGTILEDFLGIYHLQEKNYAFTTPEKLLGAANPNFPNMTRESIRELLKKSNFRTEFIEELAESVMNVNYGQSVDINGFVGSVSLAGAMPGLWSVHGGNRKIVEGLVKVTVGQPIKNRVAEVTLLSNQSFKVVSVNSNTGEIAGKTYDVVVLATPRSDNHPGMEFKGFPHPLFPEKMGSYQQTVSTLVQGELDPESVGLTSEDHLTTVLTNNQDLFFNSISRLFPVDYTHSETRLDPIPTVYKIFSKKILTDKQLKQLFKKIKDKVVKVWSAYPKYDLEKWPKFRLHRGFYYTSPIEWAASAMEMGAISGRNAALLAFHEWKGETGRVDQQVTGKVRLQDEL